MDRSGGDGCGRIRSDLAKLHIPCKELLLSAIKSGVTPDSDIDHCCRILLQLAIVQSERSLAREFFHQDQKVGENDEDYSRSLQLLAEGDFKGCLSQSDQLGGRPILRGSPTSIYRHEAQCNEDNDLRTAPDICSPDVLPTAKSATLSLDPLTPDPKSSRREDDESDRRDVAKDHNREESWTSQFFMCPELVCDAMLGVDFLRKTGAILSFAECTFTAQQHKAIKSVEPSVEKDADEICSALFEAAGIPVNNLEELCSRLTNITDSERKELHSLLCRYF
ncbi:unnamed protein product [Taenia asiatica]|uniref:DUF5726 domain-containing protein n=1 Tax=Taenia asiatica TaxID=60517 RepID=A0A0R3VYJ0_TAEAS|nr:unnamed protein product [Taenia asiatica]